MQELVARWDTQLSQSALAVQERRALPKPNLSLTWRGDDVKGLMNTLSYLQERMERRRHTPNSDENRSTAEREELRMIEQQLMLFDRAALTEETHRFHFEAFQLCMELLDDSSGTFGVIADQECFDTEDSENVGAQKMCLELSQEQENAVSFLRSAFIQGRSGTGKTLVLAQRMLRSRKKTKLFVTKSSLLRDDVVDMLRHKLAVLSVPMWPQPRNSVICLTWEEVQELILDGSISKAKRSRASVSYSVFETEYWPKLKVSESRLHPLLVWSEFTTRLRPFGPSMMKGLSLKEYQADDMSAMGFQLRAQDLHMIHNMFVQYTGMKKSTCALDDVDVAALMQSKLDGRNAEACHTDGIFVDEVQDFSPAELTLLISLCKDPDGITMVGDTCQTINPGSSFSFNQLMDAFHVHGGAAGRSIQTKIEKANAKVPHNTSKLGRLKMEKIHQQKALAENATATLAIARASWEEAARESHILNLHYNYRCMKGVAELAASTTQLLLARFPNCADPVIEHPLQEGREIPLYVGLPGADPSACIMGKGSCSIPTGYPVRVVVLVRNKQVREDLKMKGVRATILTVAEAKGLEFDIVIIYGFLASSPNSNIWNLADPKSHESEIASLAAQSQGRYALDAYSLALAIPELKSLYVAISRAQIGCAVLECEDLGWEGDVGEPLIQSWQQAGLVKTLQGETCYKQEAASSYVARLPEGDEMPSLVMMLEKRFSGTLAPRFNRRRGLAEEETIGDVINTFQCRGLQLFRHALDDTRDRWDVFDEAFRALQECRRLVHMRLDLQLHGGESAARQIKFRDMLQSESILHRDKPVDGVSFFVLCIQASLWHRSGRKMSTLRLITRFDVIDCILSFLGMPAIGLAGRVVLERVREHAETYSQLTHQMVLCRAWYLRCQSELGNEIAKNDLKDNIRSFLQQGSIQDAWDEETLAAPAEKHTTNDMRCLLLSRPEKLAEAARAFCASSRPALAALAFAEANEICASHDQLLSNAKSDICWGRSGDFIRHVCEQQGLLSTQLKVKCQSYAGEAAQCLLLVADGTDCAGMSRVDALKDAERHFCTACNHFMAAMCATRRHDFSGGFGHLADHAERDLTASKLGLISLALRQVISRADTNTTEASMMAQLLAEPAFALASRTSLLLYSNFDRLAQTWHSRAKLYNRWRTLCQKSLNQSGWRCLVALLGHPSSENRKQFWSNLGLVSIRISRRALVDERAPGDGFGRRKSDAVREYDEREEGDESEPQQANWDGLALALF